jgi:hypothetical protein
MLKEPPLVLSVFASPLALSALDFDSQRRMPLAVPGLEFGSLVFLHPVEHRQDRYQVLPSILPRQ